MGDFAEGTLTIRPYKNLPYIGKGIKIEDEYWIVREITKLEWSFTDLRVTCILQKAVEKSEKEYRDELKVLKKKIFKVIDQNRTNDENKKLMIQEE